MLPKQERLKYSGLFQQAYNKGKPNYSANFVVTCTATLANYQDKLPFVGFVVSKGFSKKAVLRNRIKRQIREVYRLYRLDPNKESALKKIGLLVISIKKNFALVNFQEIKTELEALLNQALKKFK